MVVELVLDGPMGQEKEEEEEEDVCGTWHPAPPGEVRVQQQSH